jgi:hypothetical protein
MNFSPLASESTSNELSILRLKDHFFEPPHVSLRSQYFDLV